MFKNLSAITVAISLTTISAFAADVAIKTDSDKASYGIGLNIGQSIKQQKIPDMNVDALILGLEDAMQNIEARVSKEELAAAFTNMQKKEEANRLELASKNLKEGQAYLEKNAKRKEIKTTKSGLQYEIIKTGKGAKPVAEDVVITNYKGTLIDGTEFDSSYKRNEPVEFPVNRVIPGWTEALQLMPVGSEWKLYIPADLAYGEFSPTPAIPPNSTLVFNIELLDIKAKEETKEPIDS